MEHKKEHKSALHVQQGVEQPSSVNEDFLKQKKKVPKVQPAEYYVNGILRGDRILLSQAITLVESSLPQHHQVAQSIIALCLPHSKNSIRIGITGVPGVGKSTFIEALGMHLTARGHRLAVLAIDPSSQRSKGSILGDKTRMEELSVNPAAYIRPSPSAGSLGGVARKTRESALLCEAAGFDVIIIETVGVGQSETAVHSMVDFFLLLMLAGAGDELQGIKRGIMEMADGIAINKADGDNIRRAEIARMGYQNALHLFPPAPSGYSPKVLVCSARTQSNIDTVWEMIEEYIFQTRENGYFEIRRKNQASDIMREFIDDTLKSGFYSHPTIQDKIREINIRTANGEISPYQAAQILLKLYSDLTGK